MNPIFGPQHFQVDHTPLKFQAPLPNQDTNAQSHLNWTALVRRTSRNLAIAP